MYKNGSILPASHGQIVFISLHKKQLIYSSLESAVRDNRSTVSALLLYQSSEHVLSDTGGAGTPHILSLC